MARARGVDAFIISKVSDRPTIDGGMLSRRAGMARVVHYFICMGAMGRDGTGPN